MLAVVLPGERQCEEVCGAPKYLLIPGKRPFSLLANLSLENPETWLKNPPPLQPKKGILLVRAR